MAHGAAGQESFLLLAQIRTCNADRGDPFGLERNVTAALPLHGFIGRSKRTEETVKTHRVLLTDLSGSLRLGSLSGYVHTLHPRLQMKLTFFFNIFFSIFFFFFSLVLNETKGPLGVCWAASSIPASQHIP